MNRTLDVSAERSAIAETIISSASDLIQSGAELSVVAAFCDTLCRASEHILLAWTWFGHPDSLLVFPQVYAGKASDFAKDLKIVRDPLTEQGPAFSVLLGQQIRSFEISPDSPYPPWRHAATVHGIANSLAVPLASPDGKEVGIFVIYTGTPDYFDLMGVGLFKALGKLFSSVMSSYAEVETLKTTVLTDSLTGAMNRHAMPSIERRMERQSESDPTSFVMLIDIDHFKNVNDTYGHAVGDTVLQKTAQLMRSTLRKDDDLIRWGGEEFVVCLAQTSREKAMILAEKLRAAVEANKEPLPVTISVGVAPVLAHRPLTESMIEADRAVYLAKHSGRNCVRNDLDTNAAAASPVV
ncbi:MAG: GGDEF domain-containing protein [Rhodoferax sp.]|uniref:GGDEF domain-containing protein n=1 Tax=Rhodoferax sp. TaxID=50421 RepID=UPI002ACE60C4|nr:GGDEF domain-containing protein [Rhodoferax sp.]MDZ7891575.1 GGDEF domain-containing protein [Rhodoferax sp.]